MKAIRDIAAWFAGLVFGIGVLLYATFDPREWD